MSDPTPKLDFSKDMSYGDYLALDDLLAAQRPLSDHHDEMLFIIQHQTSELWMRLMLHELTAARQQIIKGELQPAFKMMARVSRIMEQLVRAWDVLSTLTPSEYSQFRGMLGHSSGFQSHQYRMIEFILGAKHPNAVKPFAHKPALYDPIMAEFARPSLYDEANRLLARRGFDIQADVLERDFSQRHGLNPSVEAAWLTVYRNHDQYWELYELAEELVDLEDSFRQWRFRHITTVERVIGFKRGTGGSSGVAYLKAVLEHELFPELWKLRTDL